MYNISTKHNRYGLRDNHVCMNTDEDQIKLIEEAMADIANKSCIKFVARNSEDEHAVIIQVRLLYLVTPLISYLLRLLSQYHANRLPFPGFSKWMFLECRLQ